MKFEPIGTVSILVQNPAAIRSHEFTDNHTGGGVEPE